MMHKKCVLLVKMELSRFRHIYMNNDDGSVSSDRSRRWKEELFHTLGLAVEREKSDGNERNADTVRDLHSVNVGIVVN